MKRLAGLTKIFLSFSAFLMFIGCAPLFYQPPIPAELEPMFYHVRPLPLFHKPLVRLGEVTGGEKTDPRRTTRIDNDVLRYAIKKTLMKCGLVSGVVDQGPADYLLTAVIRSQQLVGKGERAELVVAYRLTGEQTGVVHFDKQISSVFSIGRGASLSYVDRSRVIHESVIRRNMSLLGVSLCQPLSGLPPVECGVLRAFDLEKTFLLSDMGSVDELLAPGTHRSTVNDTVGAPSEIDQGKVIYRVCEADAKFLSGVKQPMHGLRSVAGTDVAQSLRRKQTTRCWIIAVSYDASGFVTDRTVSPAVILE